MAKNIIYELYPLAWPGGFAEMTDHLERIAALYTDYVLLAPFYTSPRYDNGYDITDYQNVDRRLGDLEDFAVFVETAHSLGMGVLIDLVLNHTSVNHPWFTSHTAEYYCWRDSNLEYWRNLIDGGPAWTYNDKYGKYYCHLFGEGQADLNWYRDGELNSGLLDEFWRIIDFWTDFYVDGFRIDFPQGLNKDLRRESLIEDDLLEGDIAIEVINALFPPDEDYGLVLMTDLYEPGDNEISRQYSRYTRVDFITNSDTKYRIREGERELLYYIAIRSSNKHFTLDLESHNSPRFPSQGFGVNPKKGLSYMTKDHIQNICIYQGQELGLKNPTQEELPDDQMFRLDLRALSFYRAGETPSVLRLNSRANTRVPLPMEEYERQERDKKSFLNLTKEKLFKWKVQW